MSLSGLGNSLVMEKQQRQQPAGLLDGTDEQQAIWDELLTGTGHLMVNAVAGSGKSTTCIEGAKRLRSQPDVKRQSVAYLAFNKHVQSEMQARAGGVLNAKTFHALGLQAVTKALGAMGGVKVDERRMWGVIEAMRDWKRYEYPLKAGVKQLSALAKQYNATTEDHLAHLLDFHGLDYGSEEKDAAVVALTPIALEKATEFVTGEVAHIDYDDMCWLPVALELQIERAGVALVDEAQDLNPVQQWLALRAGLRLAIVGDRHQAIYGFRGSDIRSMDNLAALAELPGGIDGLGTRLVRELPLSFTRRCPGSHVALAQKLVPGIHALPDAIDGSWGLRTPARTIQDSRPGDMIISRTNAPLIEMAYKILATGKRAVIKGKDIGRGIKELVAEASHGNHGMPLDKLLRHAEAITDREAARFRSMRGGKGEMRAALCEDRMNCLVSAIAACDSLMDLTHKLEVLFSAEDNGDAIVLGTVHSVKGLEAYRVTILRPDLFPHPLAIRPHEIQQELNCLYVALTRSRDELWFAGELPGLLGDFKKQK